ncbi:hypothetical protein PR048_017976 [Dryococelus australis]|uniref:RNA-directed DNA polymerase n=1 Tax=Dryococelus australis TaxID=614101 RepID=A0ABQ9HB59_9NEOP|nr:hypothetical protein PR048_017976 [Dryococelus australis]
MRYSTPPVLALHDFNKIFILQVDASSVAIGGVLLQDMGQDPQPIAFASRLLNSSEQHLSTHEKEAYTDNQALTWLYSHPKQVGKIGRWVAKFNNYHFKIGHIKGKDNVIADYLSIMYDEGQYDLLVEPEPRGGEGKNVLEKCNVVIKTMPEMFLDFKEWQKEDEECGKLKDVISLGTSPNHVIDKELIYYVDRFKSKKVSVPKKARNLVLKYFHDIMRGANMGRTKSKALIKREFFSPSMSTKIDKSVKECENCQMAKQPQNIKVGLHTVQFPSRPPLLIVNGKHMGDPNKIDLDNANYFNSKVIKYMCLCWGVTHINTSPYHPCPNLVALRIFHNADQRRSDSNLPEMNKALNSVPHSSTGFSPTREKKICINLEKDRKSVEQQYNKDRLENPFRLTDLVVCWYFAKSKKAEHFPTMLIRFLVPVTVSLGDRDNNITFKKGTHKTDQVVLPPTNGNDDTP